MELYPFRATWEASDPHANFKSEVAAYSVADPMPALRNLSSTTGIPLPCLIRYILVKYAASAGDALLAMGPIVFEQMRSHIARAEEAGTDSARLEAYESLRQIIAWLQASTTEQN